MTDPEFREGMALLATAFPAGAVDEARLRLYWLCLQDLDGPSWAQGVLRVIRGQKFFPTVAELREACEPRVTLQAARMFDQVTALRRWRPDARHEGWPTLELVGERLGQAAMEAYQVAGGPAAFAEADRQGEMTWVRKAFLEEFQTARRRGVQDVPALPPDPRFVQLAQATAATMGRGDHKQLAAGERP